MVCIEIEDDTLRASLASFLDANFGGSVFDREGAIELDFRAAATPTIEIRLVARLLQAWRSQFTQPAGVGALLTASPSGVFASTEEPALVEMRIEL